MAKKRTKRFGLSKQTKHDAANMIENLFSRYARGNTLREIRFSFKQIERLFAEALKREMRDLNADIANGFFKKD